MCFSPSSTAKRSCPVCGEKQDVENTICSKCGAELGEMRARRRDRECPECGMEQPITNRKCTGCGYVFSAGGARKGPSGPSGPSGPQ